MKSCVERTPIFVRTSGRFEYALLESGGECDVPYALQGVIRAGIELCWYKMRYFKEELSNTYQKRLSKSDNLEEWCMPSELADRGLTVPSF
jgi:hypothetical protein